MSKKAARLGDMAKHDVPHCHGGHKPNPHSPVNNEIQLNGAPTVEINGKKAATMGSVASNCTIAGCAIPKGPPGSVASGSSTVIVCGQPAARVGDVVAYGCGPGKIIGPGSSDVEIGD